MCPFWNIRILKSDPWAALVWYWPKLKHQDWFILKTCWNPFSGFILCLVPVLSKMASSQILKCFCVSSKADWHDETVSWLLETVFEKWEKILQVTAAAGCSRRWNESTHYVRTIAVFKISLTLCVSICRAFGQIGKWKPRGRREDWLVVIYKHCVLWLPFPRLKHKKRMVTRCVFFFHARI